MSLTGFLLQQIARKVDQVTAPQFTCDACERPFRGEPVTSAMLPCSVFCGQHCKNEAEQAAIDARSAMGIYV